MRPQSSTVARSAPRHISILKYGRFLIRDRTRDVEAASIRARFLAIATTPLTESGLQFASHSTKERSRPLSPRAARPALLGFEGGDRPFLHLLISARNTSGSRTRAPK